MGVFSSTFNIADPKVCSKLERSIIELSCRDIAKVEMLRHELAEDGINLDGRIFSAGNLAIASRTGDKHKQEIPDAITRIEYVGEPGHSVVSLRPAFGKFYAGGAYYACVVPYAPDIEGMKVTDDDIRRTIQVLKAEKKGMPKGQSKADFVNHLRPDNMVFLKNEDGQVMRYPENASDPDFAGKPIAFIRDLNCIQKDLRLARSLKNMGDAEIALEEMGAPKLADLPEAPKECVEACKQQYELTATLHQNLKEQGVMPNIYLPPAPPVQSHAIAEQVGPAQEVGRRV